MGRDDWGGPRFERRANGVGATAGTVSPPSRRRHPGHRGPDPDPDRPTGFGSAGTGDGHRRGDSGGQPVGAVVQAPLSLSLSCTGATKLEPAFPMFVPVVPLML